MEHEKIAQIIENGGLVILPTDTVYGIMGDATNPKSIEKVNLSKKRDKGKKLILLVDSVEMAKKYTKNINELEMQLFKNYSNLSVTIELKKNENLPAEYNRDVDFVGVRIPYNDDLIKIIKLLNKPIFSTSANISGEPVITDISLLNEDLKKYIDYIYDAGTVNNLASTIVKVEDDKIRIIREGNAAKIIKRDFENRLKI